jgi:predicted regulator of Ras-like GTPase activity (Roadblock/LC7/MglB family)
MIGLRLGQLREVPGVEGSFAVSAEGMLLESDVIDIDPARLNAAAGSIINLLQAGEDALNGCETLSCRFGDRCLEVLALDFGCLCVLATQGVDRRLLAVVMRMVGKRISLLGA